MKKNKLLIFEINKVWYQSTSYKNYFEKYLEDISYPKSILE